MDLKYTDYCHDPRGFRQFDLTPRVTYDRAYLDARYAAIDDRVRALAARRVWVLSQFVPTGGELIDFGCGTGRVVEAATGKWASSGCDLVHPSPFTWLSRGRLDWPGRWDVATFFDSLEHVPDPDVLMRELNPTWVMISVPWCHRPGDPAWFMRWKHRRPGEHLWHWGRESLDGFFASLGYRPVMHSSFEDEYRPNPDQPEPNILTAIYKRA